MTGVEPVAAIDAVTVPLPLPRVQFTPASPEASVVWVVLLSVPAPESAQVTVTFGTGLSYWSITLTCKGSSAPMRPLSVVLPTAVMAAAGPGVAIAVKMAEIVPVLVVIEAVIESLPAAEPRVQAIFARPLALVTTLVLLGTPPKALADQVTVTPESGLLLTSVTSTVRESGNVDWRVAVWAVPRSAVMYVAGVDVLVESLHAAMTKRLKGTIAANNVRGDRERRD